MRRWRYEIEDAPMEILLEELVLPLGCLVGDKPRIFAPELAALLVRHVPDGLHLLLDLFTRQRYPMTS